MNRILDRIILLIVLYVSVYLTLETKLIYIILMGIIFSFLELYFMESKVHKVLVVALGVLIVIDVMYMPLIILMLYEALYGLFQDYKENRLEICVAFITVVLLAIQYICGLENVYIENLSEEPIGAALSVIDIVLAMYLSYMSVQYMIAKRHNIKMRDDNEEFRQLTFQKSKLQKQQQDNEIIMATLNERNRIAREIHDNVGHLLSRSILQMGALQTVYKEEPLNSSLKQVSATLNESMTSIRNSVHDIHNDSLDLEKSINDIISKNNNVSAELYYDVDSEMTKELKYCIISIVTEAFENVRKHSDSTKVEISFIEHPAFYKFVFKDNGNAQKIRESGIGLHNMKSRISEFDGKIEFMTDNGFTIFASIPKKVMQNGG